MLSRTSNIVNDNRNYTDSFKICELFKDFVTSVTSRIHESIPPPISEDDFSYDLHDTQINNPFEFSPKQTDEMENAILSLKEKNLISLLIPIKIKIN